MEAQYILITLSIVFTLMVYLLYSGLRTLVRLFTHTNNVHEVKQQLRDTEKNLNENHKQ